MYLMSVAPSNLYAEALTPILAEFYNGVSKEG